VSSVDLLASGELTGTSIVLKLILSSRAASARRMPALSDRQLL
jgi:hypothetical protein